MALAALASLWLVAALQVAPPLPVASISPVVVPPYKAENSWTFFRNESNGNCTAGATQPSGSEVVMMAYDAKQKAFSINFTTSRADGLRDGDERTMDIRLLRGNNVVDDGWEDVRFSAFNFPDGHLLFVGQLMDVPATRDFAEVDRVVFIDRGKTAGSFRMRDPGLAMKEMVRCARGVGRAN